MRDLDVANSWLSFALASGESSRSWKFTDAPTMSVRVIVVMRLNSVSERLLKLDPTASYRERTIAETHTRVNVIPSCGSKSRESCLRRSQGSGFERRIEQRIQIKHNKLGR